MFVMGKYHAFSIDIEITCQPIQNPDYPIQLGESHCDDNTRLSNHYLGNIGIDQIGN